MKKVYIILIAIIVCCSPVLSKQIDEKPDLKQYHVVHEVIDSLNFLTPSVSCAIIGYLQSGVKGAVIGATFGVIDEILNTVGIFDDYYITSGLIGVAVTSKFPKLDSLKNVPLGIYVNEIIGFLLGSYISYSDSGEGARRMVDPAFHAIAGYSYAGQNGILLAFSFNIVDELLNIFEVTDENYFSESFYTVAQTGVVAPKIHELVTALPYVKSIAPATKYLNNDIVKDGIALFVFSKDIFFNGEGEEEIDNSPLALSDELNDLFGDLVDRETLDEILKKYYIVIFTTEIFLCELTFKIDGLFKKANMGFDALKSYGKDGVDKSKLSSSFARPMISIAKIFITYPAQRVIMKVLNYHFANEISNLVNDAIKERFVGGEVPLKLALENNEALIDQLDKNAGFILDDGVDLLVDALEKSICSSYYMGFLISSKFTDTIVILTFYDYLIKYASSYLAKLENSYVTPIREVESKISTIKKDFYNQANSIILEDKSLLMAQNFDKFIDELRELNTGKKLAHSLTSSWERAVLLTNFVVSNTLIAQKVIFSGLSVADQYKMLRALRYFFEALSWESQNSLKIEELKLAMNGLDDINGKMKKEVVTSDKRASYFHEKAEELLIELSDFSVGFEDRAFVHVDKLSLESKIYAIYGDNGCGKSSFLAKLKGVVNDGIWSKGTVIYKTPSGDRPKIVFVTQDDYLAPYSTLLELIILESMKAKGRSEIDKLKKDITLLLNRLEFDKEGDNVKLDDWLEKEQNWSAVLSGGQKKKIALVSVIIRHPDVAILDEIFNGMDEKSIKISQKLLIEKLPNSMILIVDHHARKNNFDGFYDVSLHFEDQKILED